MFIVSHPTGNANVRAVLRALDESQMLRAFYTTLAVSREDKILRFLPESYRREVERRAYNLHYGRVIRFPHKEIVRQLARKMKLQGLTTHETGWASVDAVYTHLDHRVAKSVRRGGNTQEVKGVYCYEDGALETFQAAGEYGLKRIYDLPIAYWQTAHQLLTEEAQRLPEWESTLVGTRDSAAKRDRKTAEMEAADVVITPSAFTYRSLPEHVRQTKKCYVTPFGSPCVSLDASIKRPSAGEPLRVLFAGSMTQRKGLADVFAAIQMLNRSDVELVVLGSPVAPLAFYKSQYPDFRYEPPRPHSGVLQLMQSCHIFVLPSLVEGRALVQQEAMACGLPLIVTANAGGEDLVFEGQTGFLVPIRSPEAIASKINWFAEHRAEMEIMSVEARHKAGEYTWEEYGCQIVRIAMQALNLSTT
jgi:glycosyltransferase involved in cell wall biosynthesis